MRRFKRSVHYALVEPRCLTIFLSVYVFFCEWGGDTVLIAFSPSVSLLPCWLGRACFLFQSLSNSSREDIERRSWLSLPPHPERSGIVAKAWRPAVYRVETSWSEAGGSFGGRAQFLLRPTDTGLADSRAIEMYLKAGGESGRARLVSYDSLPRTLPQPISQSHQSQPARNHRWPLLRRRSAASWRHHDGASMLCPRGGTLYAE